MVRRVVVDENVCLGNGLCLEFAPGFFDLDDRDIAVVQGEPTEADVQTAILGCPTQAIRIVDEG